MANMAAATYVFVVGILASNLAEFFADAGALRQTGPMYNSTIDCVVVFNNLTLDKIIYDSPKSWVVEFYSSWCGHCVRFAPTYKSFAIDIKDWKDVVDVGAIDCATSANFDICRSHKIQAFPTLQIFHPYTEINITGTKYKVPEIIENVPSGRTLEDLRHGLIDEVEKYVPDVGRKSLWPHLTPVNASWIIEFFTKHNSDNVTHLAVVFEDTVSYHGRELILDMTPHRSEVVVCRTMMTDNPLVDKWFIHSFPSLFVIDKSLSPKALSLSGNREMFNKRLLLFLGKPLPDTSSTTKDDIPKVDTHQKQIDAPDVKQPIKNDIETEGAAAQIPAAGLVDHEVKDGFIAKNLDAQEQEEEEEEEEESQGADEDSLKDDFEAGEENALIAGLAVPDDFNAGLQENNRGDIGEKESEEKIKVSQQQQDLWDKVHKKGKDKAHALDVAVEDKQVKRPPIHMLDLESTLHYALRHEIPLHGVLKGDVLEALKAFITVLARYFPGRPQVMNYLLSLRFWMDDRQTTDITSDDWLIFVNRQYDAEMPEDAFLPKQMTWVGCEGSQPHYRGYPCGLWTLFHMLTVSHVSTNRMIDDPDVSEVLRTMKGFIKHFFTCRDCSKNFAKESATIEFEIKSLDDSILWLWRTHNRVNQRLHGDETEDPKHPKVLFPPKNICPSCRGGDEAMWQEKNVLVFLKDFYGLKNINFDNLETELEDPESNRKVTKGGESANEVKRRVRERFRQKEVELRLQRVEGKLGGGYFGLGVNGLDLSMCFVLYVSCAALVTLIYMLIWRRRRRRIPKYSV